MKRSASTLVLAGFALAACGGNVILDGMSGASSSSGGLGGAGGAGVSSAGGSQIFTVAASTANSVASTGAGAAGPCGSTHLYADPACEACTETSCCSQLAACDVGTPCFQTLDCIANCPQANPSCQMGCLAMSPDEGQSFSELATCFNDACGNLPCGSPTIDVCDSGLPPVGSTACATCLTFACCSQAEACGQSGVCQKCYAAHASMGCDPTYDALFACRQSFCPNACP